MKIILNTKDLKKEIILNTKDLKKEITIKATSFAFINYKSNYYSFSI